MPNRIENRGSQSQTDATPNVATNEVLDEILDNMPSPSSAAEEILAENSESERDEGNSKEESVKTTPVKPLEWITESAAEPPPQTDMGNGRAVDKSGVSFDAGLHCVNEDGTPTLTKTGKFRKKKGGVVSGPQPNVQMAFSASLATVYAIEMLGSAIGGDEWKPENAEHEMMVAAWQDYYAVSGMSGPPPFLGIIIATGCYALPRLTKPVTVSRLGRMRIWMVNSLGWMLGRGRVKKDESQSNHRYDGER